jgi:hypothetical protein
MAGTINARVRHVVATAKARGCASVQLARVVGRSEEMISQLPIENGDEGAIADRIAESITDELETLAGSHAFIVRAVGEGGAEVARERIREAGRAKPGAQIVRAGGTSVELAGTMGEISEPYTPDGSLTGNASTAVLVALSRQQMKHNEAMTAHLVALSARVHDPLVRQVEILGAALTAANSKLLEAAGQHVEMVRQSRVLEAEARAEERKAQAWAATGEQLAKWLPVALARISRAWGMGQDGAAADDPMLEKLVLSFTPDQLGQMQATLRPEQIQLFAEVWTNYDEKRQRREAEKKAAPQQKNGANGAKA